MAHEIAHVTARHAAQRAEFAKTAALFAQGQRPGAGALAGARGGRRALPAVDRELLARAGVRGGPDRHQGHRAGRLRSLRRGPLPDRARRMERARRLDFGRAVGRPAGHDGDAPLDAGADRRGARRKRARSRRRAKARRAATPIWPRSTASCSATTRPRASSAGTSFIHPKLGFAFEAPVGLHAREPVRRADRRRRRRRRGAAARQHPDLGFDPGRDGDRLRLDRRREDDRRRGPADRRPRRRDRDGARRPVELPPRRPCGSTAASTG